MTPWYCWHPDNMPPMLSNYHSHPLHSAACHHASAGSVRSTHTLTHIHTRNPDLVTRLWGWCVSSGSPSIIPDLRFCSRPISGAQHHSITSASHASQSGPFRIALSRTTRDYTRLWRLQKPTKSRWPSLQAHVLNETVLCRDIALLSIRFTGNVKDSLQLPVHIWRIKVNCHSKYLFALGTCHEDDLSLFTENTSLSSSLLSDAYSAELSSCCYSFE